MLTIIGDAAFHGPVRDGKGWYHRSIVVRHNLLPSCIAAEPIRREDPLPKKRDRIKSGFSEPNRQQKLNGRFMRVVRHPQLCFAVQRRLESDDPPDSLQSYRVKPHGQLVPVSLTCHHASTPGLSTSWSRTTLQGDQVPGRSHLQASFPLRCFQRLSLPHIATLQCHWRDNRYTRGASTPVLSY